MGNFTQWFVIASVVIWLIVDVILIKYGKRAESQEIRDWSLRWSWVPYAVGIVCGHWFLPGHGINGDLKYVFGSIPAFICWDVAYHEWKPKGRDWYRFPALYFVLGFPVGAFLWFQPIPA